MRRYKVTTTVVGIMVLVAAFVGFGAVVLADQPKDSAANQSQPASQLQNQAPEVEGCGAWYLLQHRDELFPTTELHTKTCRNCYLTFKEGVCGFEDDSACFYTPNEACAWEFEAREGRIHSECTDH